MTRRILFIDVIKIVAMVCVVGLHTTAGFPVLYSSCSIAIPLFFMSTGYLMWDRQIGLRYIFKKALLIARYVIIANLLYWIIFCISNNSWNIEDFIKGLSVTGGHPFWQFWFLGSLLIVYALFPLFQRLKQYVIPIIITLFVLMQGVFFMNFFGINDMPLEKNIPQTYRMYNWIFYSLLGGGGENFFGEVTYY